MAQLNGSHFGSLIWSHLKALSPLCLMPRLGELKQLQAGIAGPCLASLPVSVISPVWCVHNSWTPYMVPQGHQRHGSQQREKARYILLFTTLPWKPHSVIIQAVMPACPGSRAGNTDISLLIVYVCVLIAQSCPTLCDPVDYNPPGSSVPGILQGLFLTRGRTQVSCTAGRFFTTEPPGKQE